MKKINYLGSLFIEPMKDMPLSYGPEPSDIVEPRVDLLYFETPKILTSDCTKDSDSLECCDTHSSVLKQIYEDIDEYIHYWERNFSNGIIVSKEARMKELWVENVFNMYKAYEQLVDQYPFKKVNLNTHKKFLDYCFSHFGKYGLGVGVFMNLIQEKFLSWENNKKPGHVHHQIVQFMVQYFCVGKSFLDLSLMRSKWIEAMPSFAGIDKIENYDLVNVHFTKEDYGIFGKYSKRVVATPEELYTQFGNNVRKLLIKAKAQYDGAGNGNYMNDLRNLKIDLGNRLMPRLYDSVITQTLRDILNFVNNELMKDEPSGFFSKLSDEEREYYEKLNVRVPVDISRLSVFQTALYCVWSGIEVDNENSESVFYSIHPNSQKIASRLVADYSKLITRSNRTGADLIDQKRLDKFETVYLQLSNSQQRLEAFADLCEMKKNIQKNIEEIKVEKSRKKMK